MTKPLTFKEKLYRVKFTDNELVEYNKYCKNWHHFVKYIRHKNKHEMFRILSYLIRYRPQSITLLRRAVSRYNTAAKITEYDLL